MNIDGHIFKLYNISIGYFSRFTPFSPSEYTYLYIRQFLLPTYLFKSPNIFSKVWDGPSVECVLFKTFLDFHQNLVKLGKVVGHIGYLLQHHQVLSNSDQKKV